MFYDVYVELCRKIGKKPSVVAAELGINKSNVSNWKNNGYTPRGEALQKIADYFGVTTDFLLTGEQKEKSPSKIGEGKHHIPDKETLKLLELLETREDIRYLAAASERATPEHVKATAKMFDELYGRNQDK